MPTPIQVTDLGMNVSHPRYTFLAIRPNPGEPLLCEFESGWAGEQTHRLISLYGQFAHIRVMNWTGQLTKNRNFTWADRASMADFDASYNGDGWQDTGLPLEAIILFANACGKPISWTFPQQCDQNYMVQAGILFGTHYTPSKLWVEGPNEIWNPSNNRDWFYSTQAGGDKGEVYRLYARDCATKWVSFIQGFNSVNRTSLGLGPCEIKRFIGGQTTNQWVLESQILPNLSSSEYDGFYIACYFGDKQTLPGQYVSGHSGAYNNTLTYMTSHKALADSLGKEMGIYEGGQSINFSQPTNHSTIDSQDVRNRNVAVFQHGRDLGLYPMFFYSGAGDRNSRSTLNDGQSYSNNWPIYKEQGFPSQRSGDYDVVAPVVYDMSFPTLSGVRYTEDQGDTTPPTIVSAAIISGSPNRMRITMSEPIVGTTGFSVTAGGASVAASILTSSGSEFVLSLARAIYTTEVVLLSYTPGDVGDLAPAPNPNMMVAVSDVAVDVSGGVIDPIPYLVAAQVAANNDLQLIFSEDIANYDGFTITVNGTPTALASVGDVLAEYIVFTLASDGVTVYRNDTVTIAYTPGDVEDLGGNALEAFSGVTVDTSRRPVTSDTTAPTLSTAVLGGAGDNEITLTFDENITGTVGFTLNTDGAPFTITDIVASGTTIVITVGRPILASETMTLDYTPGNVTDTSENALASFSGTAVDVSAGAGADVTAPTFVSAEIIYTTESAELRIIFDEPMANYDGFTLTVNGASAVLGVADVIGEYIIFPMVGSFYSDDTVTLDYAAGDVTDVAGNALAGFSGESVDVSALDANPGFPVLRYSGFVAENSYDPGGYDTMPLANTSGDSMLADYNGKIIMRRGSRIVGGWRAFVTDLEDCIVQFRTDHSEGGSTTISNTRCDRRVAFDALGRAYTIVRIGTGATPEHFLCVSFDYGLTWKAYRTPTAEWARIEFNDNPTRKPVNAPAVLLFGSNKVLKVMAGSIVGGEYVEGTVTTVSTTSLLVPNHTGGANSVVSIDETQALVVWPSSVPNAVTGGTDAYAARVDTVNGVVLSTSFLGTTDEGDTPDPHNLPGLVVDSNLQAHVILGAHHGELKYVTAAPPWTTWSLATTVGGNGYVDVNDVRYGNTYIAMLLDTNDKLFVFSRYTGDTNPVYVFKIVFFAKDADGTWSPQYPLVDTQRQQYVNTYFEATILSNGEIRLGSPGLLHDRLSQIEQPIYDALWDGEVPDTDWYGGGGTWNGPYATQNLHGPFVIKTTDGGATWSLGYYVDHVMTYDAIETLIPPSVSWDTDVASGSLIASTTSADDMAQWGTGHDYQTDSMLPDQSGFSLRTGTATGGGFVDTAATATTSPTVIQAFKVWIYAEADFPATEGYILNRTSTTVAGFAVSLIRVTATTAKLKAYWNDGTNGDRSSVTVDAVINKATPHLVVVSYYEGTGIDIFVDRVRQTVTDGTDTPVTLGLDRIAIGMAPTTAGPLYSLRFQRPAVYTVPLNQPDVDLIYNGESTVYSALVDPEGIVDAMHRRLQANADPVAIKTCGNSNEGWANQSSGNLNYGRIFGWDGALTALGFPRKGTDVLMPGKTVVANSEHTGLLADAPYDMSVLGYGAATGAPAGADDFWNPDGEGTTGGNYIGPWAYRYIASGGSIDSTLGRVWGNIITIRAATSSLMGDDLTLRHFYVEGPFSTPGQFTPTFRQGSSDIKVDSAVSVSAGSYALAFHDFDIDAGEYDAGVDLACNWGSNAVGSVLGDILSFGAQVFSRNVKGGFVVSPLYGVGGKDVVEAMNAIANLQDESLIALWQATCEIMTDPFVLIDWTWAINSEDRSSQALIDASVAALTRLRATFVTAGFSASQMKFMLANDQPVKKTGNQTEEAFVEQTYHAMKEVRDSVTGAFVVGRHLVNDYATYIANGWHYGGDDSNHHLTLPDGYDGEQLAVLRAIGFKNYGQSSGGGAGGERGLRISINIGLGI